MKNPRIQLIGKLKKHFGMPNDTDTALANHLGSKSQKQNSWKTRLANWRKNASPLSNTEILNLIKDIKDTSDKNTRDEIHREFITTIVEYYPIEKVTSKGGKNLKFRRLRPWSGNGILYVMNWKRPRRGFISFTILVAEPFMSAKQRHEQVLCGRE